MVQPIPVWRDHNILAILLAKGVRMFSYGALAVPILMYFQLIGLDTREVGILMTLVMLGNFLVSWILTSRADAWGRRKVLVLSSLAMFVTGVLFSFSSNFYVLAVVGSIGIISLTGSQTGPFLAVEQAILGDISQLNEGDPLKAEAAVATTMGWYNLVGFAGFAAGSGFIGYMISFLQHRGWSDTNAYRIVVVGYALQGLITMLLYLLLDPKAEAVSTPNNDFQVLGQKQNQESKSLFMFGFDSTATLKVMTGIGLLLALDAFAGGLTPASYYSLWFCKEWSMTPEHTGLVLMFCSIACGLGAFAMSFLVKYLGVVPIMLGSNVPYHILMVMVPLMPTMQTAILVSILKSFASNMNLSCRQTYIMSLVKSHEKSASNGLAAVFRALGLVFSPFPMSYMMNSPAHSLLLSLPYYLNAGIKSIFDVLLLLFCVFVPNSTTSAKSHACEGNEQPANANMVQGRPTTISTKDMFFNTI